MHIPSFSRRLHLAVRCNCRNRINNPGCGASCYWDALRGATPVCCARFLVALPWSELPGTMAACTVVGTSECLLAASWVSIQLGLNLAYLGTLLAPFFCWCIRPTASAVYSGLNTK